uniref:RanBP2-type domain-containing protein n=1 Tax=Alexandrium monilatum TaxID=311494 RepID=A0A7S4SJ12_9DINO
MYYGAGCGYGSAPPGCGFPGGYGAGGYGSAAGYGGAADGYGSAAGYGCGGYGCGNYGWGPCGPGAYSPGAYGPAGYGSVGCGPTNSLGSGGHNSGGSSSREKEQLVERVKERQRQGESYKQAWHDFCRRKGTTNYDPMRHLEADLQEFLDLGAPADVRSGDGEKGRGCEDEALVQRVKDWQRRGDGHKQAWYSFCRKNGSDKYDPGRHDAETLRKFLDGIESGSITAREDVSTGGSCNPAPASAAPGAGAPGAPPLWGSTQMGMAGGWGGWGGWSMNWMPPMKGCGRGERGATPWDMMHMMNPMWMNGAKPGPGGCAAGGGGSSGSSTEADGRPGDWVCSNCKNVNFSRRDECNKCGSSGNGARRLGVKQGDWICPRCGDLVFANKSACTMCRATRPEEGGSSGGRYSPY